MHEDPTPRAPDGAAPPPAQGWLVRHGRLVLLALVLLEVLPTLGTRDFWVFDETRHASALHEMLRHGHWLSLHMNGRPYPDKPPVAFWVVALFAKLLGTEGTTPFFLASGLGGLLFLWATGALARRTLEDRGVGLRAALFVLTMPLFQILLRTTRMDLLFGACIVASQVLLFRGYGRDGRGGAVVGGFALATLALFVKGPVGVLLPVVSALAWLAWRGRLRRAWAWDTAAGVGVLVACLLAWGAGLWLVEGPGYLRSLLGEQVVGRALAAHAHREPPWFYLLTLPPSGLPWLFAVFALPLGAVLGRAAWRARWAARREGDGGRAYLACCVVPGFVLLSLGSSKLAIYPMPLLAPLAVLCADALGRADARGRRRFVWIAALGALALAAPLPWLGSFLPWPLALRGLVPAAVLLALTGLACLALRRRRAPVPSLALAAGLLAVELVAAVWVAPGFDAVLSPRTQARVLARYAKAGHAPLVFGLYGGAYTWYAGRDLPETRDPAVLLARAARPGPAVMALRARSWRRYRGRLPGFVVVQRQVLEDAEVVVVARPPLPAGGTGGAGGG